MYVSYFTASPETAKVNTQGRTIIRDMSGSGSAGSKQADASKCSANHGRIVKSDETTITFQDGVVMKKGTMEILHDPGKGGS